MLDKSWDVSAENWIWAAGCEARTLSIVLCNTFPRIYQMVINQNSCALNESKWSFLEPWPSSCLVFSDSDKKANLLSAKLRRQHYLNFGIAVLFSSILTAFDIGTDIATGIGFLNSGDHGWAAFTFAIICTPWLARSLISLVNFRMCFNSACETGFSRGRYLVWRDEMIDSFLEFPLFQPFRWTKLLCFQTI